MFQQIPSFLSVFFLSYFFIPSDICDLALWTGSLYMDWADLIKHVSTSHKQGVFRSEAGRSGPNPDWRAKLRWDEVCWARDDDTAASLVEPIKSQITEGSWPIPGLSFPEAVMNTLEEKNQEEEGGKKQNTETASDNKDISISFPNQ